MAAERAGAIKHQVAIFHRAVIIDYFHEDIAFGAKRIFQDALLNLNRNPAPQQGGFCCELSFAHSPENTNCNRHVQLLNALARVAASGKSWRLAD